MEKLKEELETMNDLMEQKDTLTQKLEVSETSSEIYLCNSSGIKIHLKTVNNSVSPPPCRRQSFAAGCWRSSWQEQSSD